MELRAWVERLMGLGPEWRIERVDEDSERQEARVVLARETGSALRCPECGRACPGYDVRRREWRAQDAWGYKTFVVYDVPRVVRRQNGIVVLIFAHKFSLAVLMPIPQNVSRNYWLVFQLPSCRTIALFESDDATR